MQDTCAVNITDFHAEDEAGLVSLSFSLLQHIQRKSATFGAIFMQDLDGCLAGVGILWFLVVHAAYIEQEHINSSTGLYETGLVA